jgi:hypothetical protein
MTYRLIAADLDDTLLIGEERVMHPRAKASLLKASEMGVKVVLCTGRTKQGAQRFYDELGINDLFIVSGGAQVLDADGNALFERNVEPFIAKKLLAFAYDNGITANVYPEGNLVYRESNKFTDSYGKRYGFPGIAIPDIMEKHIITPKVLFIVEADKIPEIQEAVRKEFPMLSVQRSSANFIEFSDPEVSKGGALRFVADYYGIQREEIIAFGDTEIDITMLEFAGLGVAVENADRQTKQAADLVCASNEDGGVADVIERYILEV